MTRFIVVRHGRSTANSKGVFSCMQDVPLAPIGIKQAQYVARHLAEHEHIDAIYTSGMLRTVQTAQPTAERFGLPLHTDTVLREIFAGLWEGLPYPELHQRFHEDWMNWLFDFSNARCTGGESVRELYRRVEQAIHRLASENEGRTVLLTTHCTPLRVIIGLAMGLSPEQIDRAPTPTNATVNIFNYENGCLTAEAIGLVTYPDALLSTNEHPFPPRMPQGLK